MKKIELICIGELKFPALRELEKSYREKINFFQPFDIRVIKDLKSADDDLKKRKEGQMVIKLLDGKDFVIALDPYGKKMDSLAFSALIAEKMVAHPHRLVFLIGGHAGLSPGIDPYINLKLSFSDMTFAHDIFRVLFLEQLYRAFSIINHTKYHR
jgi:23S rRNA (pseudouridine1915-N3)-methyltransferase